MKNILSVFLLLSSASISAGSESFESIYQSLYLGQAYPSGNVYMVPFVDMGSERHKYPQKIMFVRVVKDADRAVVLRTANYQNMLVNDWTKGKPLIDYIPGIEGMVDYNSCTFRDGVYKVNRDYAYLSNKDFFSTAAEGCYEFDSIGRYRFQADNRFSYMIMGYTDSIRLENIKLHRRNTMRPLTAADMKDMENEVAEMSKWEKEGACYTENRTIKDAEVYMMAEIADTGYKIRLSTYPDPGCMGHFVIKYIIDILDKQENVLESREIMARQGVL